MPGPINAIKAEGHKPTSIISPSHELSLAIQTFGETLQSTCESCNVFGYRVGARTAAPMSSANHGFELDHILIGVDDGDRDFVGQLVVIHRITQAADRHAQQPAQ